MNTVAVDVFRSPCCREHLREEPGYAVCNACGHSYSTSGGITRFASGESSHGEFSHAEMEEFLTLARDKGWRAAVDLYAQPKQMRVVRLITDPRRCSSVEALRYMGGGRVLDFGCGYGGVSLQLSKMFDQVVSLEESIDRLRRLRAKPDKKIVDSQAAGSLIHERRLAWRASGPGSGGRWLVGVVLHG